MNRRSALKVMSCTTAALAVPHFAIAAVSEQVTAENVVANLPSYIVKPTTQSQQNFATKQSTNTLLAGDVRTLGTVYGIYTGALTANGYDSAVQQWVQNTSADSLINSINPSYVSQLTQYLNYIGASAAISKYYNSSQVSTDQVQQAISFIVENGVAGFNSNVQAALSELAATLQSQAAFEGAVYPASYPVGGRLIKVHTATCNVLFGLLVIATATGNVPGAIAAMIGMWIFNC